MTYLGEIVPEQTPKSTMGGAGFTLTTTAHKHTPVVVFDARGNGGGGISPTITGDHQDRITDYTAIIVEDRHEPDSDRRIQSDD